MKLWHIEVSVHKMTEEGTFVDMFDVADDSLVHQLDKRGYVRRKKSSEDIARHKFISRSMCPAVVKEQDYLRVLRQSLLV